MEPYLTTLALYDVKANKKITEDFHFDVNQPHIRAWFQPIQVNAWVNDPLYPVPEVSTDWLSFPKQVSVILPNKNARKVIL